MKATNKRLVSTLLCLAMVLAMLPMAVFAETATTIYVQPNDNWKTDGAWFAAYFYGDSGNTWVACTDEDGDEIYAADVPAGYANVIFCRMNPADTTTLDWSNKWNQTSDLIVPTDDKVVYVVDGWDNGAGQWIELGGTAEPVETVYYLRGDMNGWDTSAPMTDNGDGTWSITMSLTAGTYQYKAADAGWGTSYPADANASVTIDADCDVTFVLDTNAGTITATADSMVEPEPVVYDYYVAGSAALCNGYEWDPAAEVNKMNLDFNTGLYVINLPVEEAGTYEYKITTGDWNTPSYGYGEGNYTVTVKVPSFVYITFNAETTEVTCTVNEYGASEVKFQLNADATAASETVDLRMITYVQTLDYSNVEFEITINGEVATVGCEVVYTAINANGATLSCADIFNVEGYLVTYTLANIPAEYYGADITVNAVYTDLDGGVISSNSRSLVLSDVLA